MTFLSILHILFLGVVLSCSKTTVSSDRNGTVENKGKENPYYSRTDTTILNVSDAEWKKILSDEVYHVAREQGTERAFTGKYWDYEGIGTYYCAVCGNAL